MGLADGELRILPVIRYIKARTDLDTDPSLDENGNLIINHDTEQNNAAPETIFLGTSIEYLTNESNSGRINIYHNQTDRDFFFDYQGIQSTPGYSSGSSHIDWQHSLNLRDWGTILTTGIEYEHQDYESDSDTISEDEQRDLYSAFLHAQFELFKGSARLAGGGRLTHIPNINLDIPTLESSLLIAIPQTGGRIHTSLAQGFRAPTLFESKGSLLDFTTGEVVSVGNPSLDEEESLSMDAGYTQPLLEKRLELDITYFHIDADQTILFDYLNMTHRNGGGGKTQGVESSLVFHPCRWFFMRAAYTHLDDAEGLDGKRRQRTPENWWALSGVAEYEKTSLALRLRYRGSQEIEFYNSPSRYKEDDVTVLDATLTYTLGDNIELYVRGENIFDVNYTEAGWKMPGASVYGGIRLAMKPAS